MSRRRALELLAASGAVPLIGCNPEEPTSRLGSTGSGSTALGSTEPAPTTGGDAIVTSLRDQLKGNNNVKEIRHKGLMIAVELHSDF